MDASNQFRDRGLQHFLFFRISVHVFNFNTLNENVATLEVKPKYFTATQMFEYDKFHSTGAGKTVRKQSVFLVYQTKFRFPFQHGKPNSLSF